MNINYQKSLVARAIEIAPRCKNSKQVPAWLKSEGAPRIRPVSRGALHLLEPLAEKRIIGTMPGLMGLFL
jgi:hypothetical protein